MKRCGDDLWWVDGSRLLIQCERKRSRLIRGGFLLFTAAASGAWLVARPGEFLSPLLVLVLSLTSGLEQLLGVRRIVLERGEHGRITWGRGLGIPFYRSERPLAAFTHVRLLTSESQSQRTPPGKVLLHGPGGAALPLSSTRDDDEALALAEAVARHAGLGLQVDGGRVRSFEETTAREGSRFRSWKEERSTSSEPEAPASARIQVAEQEGRLVATLSAPGWRGCGWRLGTEIGVLGLGLVPCYLVIDSFRSLAPGVVLSLLGGAAFILGMGFMSLRKTLDAMRTTCRLTVSRQGLEVAWAGGRAREPIRIAAHLIRDIDVRVHRPQGEQRALPMLVIEREGGELLALGAELPREALTELAGRLRQRLAEVLETRRREQGDESRQAQVRRSPVRGRCHEGC
ncbi:hypothetical protein JQX13_23060 [Archangium violaceum]|uniref:hypothetical protein n=1 Tax=Archangium violaceum TaxID=83451 RepID=UPI00193C6D7A|nr:hypothetical protein [Archangium violaceum]QRK12657.1 hypothetical protein JQX13_23060 [Archangium violaceum]